jgi:pilus assembly protein CpaE
VDRSTRGQASIETAALLPVLLLLALGCWQALLVGWTAISAEHAARSAARAELVGSSPRAAALAALPGPMRAGLQMRQGGGSMTVRVAVPRVIPGFDLALSADAELVSQ